MRSPPSRCWRRSLSPSSPTKRSDSPTRATGYATSSRASRSASNRLRDGLRRRVAPELLEPVVAAGVGREDVHDCVEIVHQDPARLAEPFDAPRQPAVHVLQLLVDRVVDRFRLTLG